MSDSALVPSMETAVAPVATRTKLPVERASLTHKFDIAGHEGYITVGLYSDGTPGEVFIVMAKAGSTVSGLMDSFACIMSIALQHGVPLSLMCDKLAHTRFDPQGLSQNEDIGYATSIMDYIARWMRSRFIEKKLKTDFPKKSSNPSIDTFVTQSVRFRENLPSAIASLDSDAPVCKNCGQIMSRNGSCYKCGNCGETSGCS